MKKDEAQDKGVKVRTVAGGLVIDLHIAVTYGVNIAAIVKSIVNKVRYTVEEATGLQAGKGQRLCRRHEAVTIKGTSPHPLQGGRE